MNLENLKKIEQAQNSGRGVSAVRVIIDFLEKGKVREAQVTFEWDFDKIRSYPEIIEELERLGIIEKYFLFGTIETYRAKVDKV